MARRLAGDSCPGTADRTEAHSHCDDGCSDRCAPTCPDLHPSLACARECDQGLASASWVGYQPRFCEDAGGEFRSGQKREALEKRRANVQRFGEAAREKAHRASLLATKLWKQTKAHGEALYRALNDQLQALEAQGVTEGMYRAERKKLKAKVDAELEPLWQRVYRVQEKGYRESSKHERYCREQRALLRTLEDLAASERVMHELDNRKDQIMTICKVALANLVMWVRDRFFPSTYAHATRAALAPLFSVARSCTMGPGGGPCGTAAFQQSSTEP